MKNADKPINPSTSIKISDTEFFEYNLPNQERQYSGLTKREHYAGLAMQGLLALPDKRTFGSFDKTIEWICEVSVKFADELLKQLEKEN